VLAKHKYKQTQTAHLPAVVSDATAYKKESHTCKQTSFKACDWSLVLFTIITLRQSYDEFVTILWSSYDFFGQKITLEDKMQRVFK